MGQGLPRFERRAFQRAAHQKEGPPMTEAARLAARLRRVEGYSQWLADDVDGLASALNPPDPLRDATVTLAEARERVALALSRLDRAIEHDKAHHQEHA